MTREALERELLRLEEVSEHIFGTAPLCLKAACAAAEVGDLATCLGVIDRAIPVLSQGEAGTLSAPLIGLCNELAHDLHAA